MVMLGKPGSVRQQSVQGGVRNSYPAESRRSKAFPNSFPPIRRRRSWAQEFSFRPLDDSSLVFSLSNMFELRGFRWG